MRHTLDTDYLVVGAGASGLAFTDALIDHADVQVVVVDRRHGPGGHWLDAYPFVRLHQASVFYGVASTRLGDGRLQPDGPEAGLQERANAPEICAYYARVMERLRALRARSPSSRAATTWVRVGSGPGCPATSTRSGYAGGWSTRTTSSR